jgi:predicted amino acid dehydrogenase
VTGQGRHIFACFAEPILVSLSGEKELCGVGRNIRDDALDDVSRLAAREGFWVDCLHERAHRVTPDRIRAFSGD